MSIAVDLSELAATIARFRFAYLLSVGDDGRAHALAVEPLLSGDRIAVSGIGRRSRHNVAARPGVTLLWPPERHDDYSLIVDGDAKLEDETLFLAPTRAVLHSPRPGSQPGSSCGSDCVELPLKKR